MSAQVARAGPTASGEVAVLRRPRDRPPQPPREPEEPRRGPAEWEVFVTAAPTRPGAKSMRTPTPTAGRHRATPAARPKARFRFAFATQKIRKRDRRRQLR